MDPQPVPDGVSRPPENREEIYCGRCERYHGDPRFCRNHTRGVLDLCVRCGAVGHLFERCCWGNIDVDDRAFFLYDCRIGLGPVATTLDCSDLVAQPGVHVRDVLTREQAREIFNNREKPYFKVAARKLDYGRFGTLQEEAMKIPPTPQTGRGPLPTLPLRETDIVAHHLVPNPETRLAVLATQTTWPDKKLRRDPRPRLEEPKLERDKIKSELVVLKSEPGEIKLEPAETFYFQDQQ
ncbi:hypothetical protein GGR58DRAFT_464920 [Xylaria digitata]|nr:hypothetical protein GGR58DRAFT_464920 [Xylaria digitata]